MAFDWLDKFQQEMEKPPDYAEKTLAAYKLGMRARGSIAGVRIVPGQGACPAVQALDPQAIYHPDEAPRLPLPGCDHAHRCRCVYRPVMNYQLAQEDDAE